MSVSLLDNYRDISCSWWDIFLKFFGDIPEMCLHLLTYLYVCQSVSWLTNLLKTGQYWNISGSGWDIFQKLLGDIPVMFLHYFQIKTKYLYVCQSFIWAHFVTEIRQMWGYLLFWIRYLSDFFETFLPYLHTTSK